jgi:hypothetical protein
LADKCFWLRPKHFIKEKTRNIADMKAG